MARERQRLFPLVETRDELQLRMDASLPAGSFLQKLVEEQVNEDSKNYELTEFGAKVAQHGKDVGGLIRAYTKTTHFQSLKERINYLRENEKLNYTMFGEIKGLVFAYAAYAALSAHASAHSQLTILSEERTLQLYRNFYNLPIALHEFSESILGVSVPDGLVVNTIGGKPQINGVLEYTTRTREPEYFRKKFDSHTTRLQVFRETGSPIGDLFGEQPLLLFLTTRFETEEEKDAVFDVFPNGEVLTPRLQEIAPWAFPFVIADSLTRQREDLQ